MTRIRLITLAAFVVIATGPIALSQYAVDWHSIDGGGAMSSTGGTYAVAGTIGQPDASSFAAPMSGGTFSVVGGFWAVAAVPTCSLPGDMDLNTHRNGMDVQDFVNCLTGVNGSNCTCADMSGNGTVGVEDVPAFVATLLGN